MIIIMYRFYPIRVCYIHTLPNLQSGSVANIFEKRKGKKMVNNKITLLNTSYLQSATK